MKLWSQWNKKAVWQGVDWNVGSVEATGVLGGVGKYSRDEKEKENLFWQIVCEMLMFAVQDPDSFECQEKWTKERICSTKGEKNLFIFIFEAFCSHIYVMEYSPAEQVYIKLDGATWYHSSLMLSCWAILDQGHAPWQSLLKLYSKRGLCVRAVVA